MTDSISTIHAPPPAIDTPAVQYAHASTHPAAAKTDAVANATLINQMAVASAENAAITNDILMLGNTQANTQADLYAHEGVVNLDTTTFLLLNNLSASLGAGTIGGNLTAEQLQASDILQQDVLGLEQAAQSTTHIALTDAASTVDLSLAAQSIASGVSTVASVNTVIPTSDLNALTPTQLKQLSDILAPVANQPLTQALLTQIQSQLAAIQVLPQQLTLSTIFLVQNYMAGEHTTNSSIQKKKETVAPVGSIDKVASEDVAII